MIVKIEETRKGYSCKKVNKEGFCIEALRTPKSFAGHEFTMEDMMDLLAGKTTGAKKLVYNGTSFLAKFAPDWDKGGLRLVTPIAADPEGRRRIRNVGGGCSGAFERKCDWGQEVRPRRDRNCCFLCSRQGTRNLFPFSGEKIGIRDS